MSSGRSRAEKARSMAIGLSVAHASTHFLLSPARCIHHPLLYFPCFYITKELVMNPKPDVWKAIEVYRGNMMEDLKALWKIWVPAMFLNFAL